MLPVAQVLGSGLSVDAAIKMKKAFFWDVMPCSLVDVRNRCISARLYGITVSWSCALLSIDCHFGSRNAVSHPHKMLCRSFLNQVCIVTVSD